MAEIILLDLPNNAIKHVIGQFNIVDLISFSLCSKVTKRHAKSLNINEKSHIEVFLNDNICNIVHTFSQRDFRVVLCPEREELLEPGNHARIDHGRVNIMFKVDNFTIADWIKHLLSILNKSRLNLLEIETPYFPSESICSVMSGIKIKSVLIHERAPLRYVQQILSELHTHNLARSTNSPFGSIQENSLLLTQNIECFVANDSRGMKFKDLLSINFRYAKFWQSRITGKELNRFVKLWKGGSCPRLKYLRLFSEEKRWWQESEVLSGIKFEIMEERRTFEDFHEHSGDFFRRGRDSGCNIARFDRRGATVVISRYTDCDTFELIVWDY